MQIHGLQKLTLLDYPGRLSAILFLGACNFRCPFCQNGHLVLSPDREPTISKEEVLAFLKKRSGLLEGVCISGGEPTLYDKLPNFIRQIKELGYLVKLDTNGTNPEMIANLHEEGLIDYVAMDIKAPLSRYAALAGLAPDSSQTGRLLDNVAASKEYLMNSGIDYEFRTTVVRPFHAADDFRELGGWLAGCRRYYLQAYKESDSILAELTGNNLKLAAPTAEELLSYQKILRKTIPATEIRGVDAAS